MSRFHRMTAPALAALLVVPVPAAGQSAGEIVQEALQRYEQRMEGVQSYTVVQEVMGFESSTRFERKDMDGQTVFVLAGTEGSDAAEGAPQNYHAMLDELGEKGSVEGTESVDGEECHVLAVTDFSGDAFAQFAPPESSGEWTPERLRLWVDHDELVPRKMVFEGETTRGGEPTPVTMTALMRDYREVDGVLHPFTMEVHTEGVGPAMSPQERKEMQASMRQLKQQMAEMSPQERKMMESMMGGQIEKMEKMLSSGAMDFTVQVKEIRVNETSSSGG